MKKEKVAPKPVVKKVAIKKPSVEMVSYSIKMVIPTGQYANIQPEIIVRGGSIQEAHDFVAPHMNKLWKEYYLVSERRPEPVKAPAPVFSYVPMTTPVANPTTVNSTIPDTMKVITEVFPDAKEIGGDLPADIGPAIQPPDSGVALIKATQAIDSCLSLDALDLIQKQVLKSVKLSKEDKESLMPLLHKKSEELFNKANGK